MAKKTKGMSARAFGAQSFHQLPEAWRPVQSRAEAIVKETGLPLVDAVDMVESERGLSRLAVRLMPANEWRLVGSLREASAVVRAFIESRDYGASDLSKTFGEVALEGSLSRPFARVSYNGRVWDIASGLEIGDYEGVGQ